MRVEIVTFLNMNVGTSHAKIGPKVRKYPIQWTTILPVSQPYLCNLCRRTHTKSHWPKYFPTQYTPISTLSCRCLNKDSPLPCPRSGRLAASWKIYDSFRTCFCLSQNTIRFETGVSIDIWYLNPSFIDHIGDFPQRWNSKGYLLAPASRLLSG